MTTSTKMITKFCYQTKNCTTLLRTKKKILKLMNYYYYYYGYFITLALYPKVILNLFII